MEGKSKHSKFKNTGILFELLTRQVTSDILSGRDESKAKDMLFKYFNESREIGKEWQLYSFLVNEQLSSEIKAERAISIAVRSRESINNKKLAEEKYSLIKEIKEAYPIDKFLKSSIKNYKVHASIYKVFENHLNNNFDVKEINQARTCLIENLVNKKESKNINDILMEIFKSQKEEIRLLSYKMLVEKVNKKYKDLNQNQKGILREYINSVSNTNSLPEFLSKERELIVNELTTLSKDIPSQITTIKLNEALHQMKTLDFSKGVKDNHVSILLLAHELIKEIRTKVPNNENK